MSRRVTRFTSRRHSLTAGHWAQTQTTAQTAFSRPMFSISQQLLAPNQPSVPERILSAAPSTPMVYNTDGMASAWVPGQTESFYARPSVMNRNLQPQPMSPTVAMTSVNSTSDRSMTTANAASVGSSVSQAPATANPPTTSKLLVDASEIVIDRTRRLGEGGFGVVYEGTFRGSIKVAVKTLKGDLDQRTINAFLKEVGNWEGLVQRNGACEIDCVLKSRLLTPRSSPPAHGLLLNPSSDDGHRSYRGGKPAQVPRRSWMGPSSRPSLPRRCD